MGREIRRVPANWKHPKEKYREYQTQEISEKFTPLHENYVRSLEYYKESVDEFIQHMTEVIEKGSTTIYDTVYKTPQEAYEYLTEDNQLMPPDIHGYMPSGTWYQLFENVSEGTPLTPPFEKPEELVEWLSVNKDFWDRTWTREQAEQMVKQGFAMSGVMVDGKMYNSEESLLLNKKS